MRDILLTVKLDFYSSIRSKWFYAYLIIAVLLVALSFSSGVTDSRISGFAGLTRVLLIFIQSCNIILPIFILITTVRTISSERDSNVLEYLLSFPISLKSYYWGKFIGRFIIVFLPIFLAMMLALILSLFFTASREWSVFVYYMFLLTSMSFAFLGIGFLISVLIKNQELALGLALGVWLLLIAFIDIVLIGLMIKKALPDVVIFSLALLNPIQLFRIGAIALFDPVLSVIGPSAYYILDYFGRGGIILFSILYPIFIGLICSFIGYRYFSKNDLI